jgi:hypothetical protein
VTGLRAEVARALTDLDAVAAGIEAARARLAEQGAAQGWEVSAVTDRLLGDALATVRRVSSGLDVASRTWGPS